MDVKVVRSIDEDGIGDWIEIEIDGSTEVAVGNLFECPEDATLSRDLSFVNNIPDMLRRAHKAGREGEPLTIIEEEEQ